MSAGITAYRHFESISVVFRVNNSLLWTKIEALFHVTSWKDLNKPKRCVLSEALSHKRSIFAFYIGTVSRVVILFTSEQITHTFKEASGWIRRNKMCAYAAWNPNEPYNLWISVIKVLLSYEEQLFMCCDCHGLNSEALG